MKKIILVAIVMALCTTTQAGVNYAVLFSGGVKPDMNYNYYYNDTLRMWDIMTGTLGYDPANVYVLFADGTETGLDQAILDPTTGTVTTHVDSDWSSVIGAGSTVLEASTSNLESTFLGLQSLITTDDCFHFWSFDHGGGTGEEYGAVLSAWNEESILDSDFASWVNPIDSYAQSFYFAQCHSGGMVDDLNILPGENRFAAWSANWDESSLTSLPDFEGWSDSLADGFESGLLSTWDLGNYAMWNDPFGPGGDGSETPGWIGANFNMITNQPIQAIPAPGAIFLSSIGVGCVNWLRRRRKL